MRENEALWEEIHDTGHPILCSGSFSQELLLLKYPPADKRATWTPKTTGSVFGKWPETRVNFLLRVVVRLCGGVRACQGEGSPCTRPHRDLHRDPHGTVTRLQLRCLQYATQHLRRDAGFRRCHDFTTGLCGTEASMNEGPSLCCQLLPVHGRNPCDAVLLKMND